MSLHSGSPALKKHEQLAPSKSIGRGGSTRSAAEMPPSRRLVLLWRFITLIAAVTLWELFSEFGLVNPVFASSPTRIASVLMTAQEYLVILPELWSTISISIVSMGLSAGFGISFAFLVTQSLLLRRVVDPFMTILNSVPRIALAPLFLVWFGIGATPRIALAFSIAFFVMFYNTVAGVDGVDREHVTMARVFGANRLAVFVKIVLPSAVPSIFAGLQLALVYSVLGVIASEMIAGSNGIGAILSRQAAVLATDRYFATLILLAIATALLSSLLNLARVRLLSWERTV